MTSPDRFSGILREEEPLLRSRGVWAVRDYHTTLEQRATAGLLLNSAAAVIGAMCVAPFMAPSRAVCIGGLFRNWPVFFGGLAKQLLGLLVIGVIIAGLITLILKQTLTGIEITPEILLRAMPTTRDVVLSTLIALSAGAAASLALVVQPNLVETSWGQVVDAIIGVEIAISLVPPAAVIGIGLALGTPEHSRNAFYLLLLNVVALDLIGSTAILAIRGVSRQHLALEKHIRSAVAVTLDVVPGFIAVGSTVHVTLLGNREALVEVLLRRRFGGQVPDSLAASIASNVAEQTLCRVDVTVEVVPLLTHSGIRN